MTKAAVSVNSLVKSFPSTGNGKTHRVLNSLSFSVPAGKIVAVFGPNGCGKSTLLHILAGLVKPDSGSIQFPDCGEHFKTGYSFQDYHKSLLPWETALDNVAFPLIARGCDKVAARKKARDFLEANRLRINCEAFPYQLSSGQQQAIALASVLVVSPNLALLDEPFSAFDHKTKKSAQLAIQEYIRDQMSAIIVSHDIDEALLVCDELVLLSPCPARTIGVFKNPFKRPRSPELFIKDEFNALRSEILKCFLEELDK